MDGKSDTEVVRVLIHFGNSAKIEARSSYEFRDTKNDVKKGSGVFIPLTSGKYISSNGEFSLNGEIYSGNLMIYADGKQFSYINFVPLDEYLVSVVAHEMSPAWPLDALKAQAVVARTYVVQKMGEARDKLYDIGNTTKDQVYSGRVKNDENVRLAVKETRAQIIKYKGDIATVFFHSSCGGETASAAEVWHEDIPYLKNKRCSFKDSPEYNWEVLFSKKDLEKKLGINELDNVTVKARTESKRAKSIELTRRGVENEITAEEFRKRLGPEKVKSTLFGLKLKGDQLIIKGHGYGHGVGLCQWCAKIMAEKQSVKYRGIIRYFFPGTNIKTI